MSDTDETTSEPGARARQLLHAATGDRDAEAHALADQAGPDVADDDAKVAVRKAHGDIPDDDREPSTSDVPEPEEAREEAAHHQT